MVIYIAGKVGGLPDLGRSKFKAAEERINGLGHTAINPALLPTCMDDKRYLPICVAMIDAADAIYMLDNWTDSAGARAEYTYAVRQGKPVFYEGMLEPDYETDPKEETDDRCKCSVYCAPTEKLVEELRKRAGVKAYWAAPCSNIRVDASGPAWVMTIVD